MKDYPVGACEIDNFLSVMDKNLYLNDQYINQACAKEPT